MLIKIMKIILSTKYTNIPKACENSNEKNELILHLIYAYGVM